MAIGQPVRRTDAVAKVTGRARFTDDYFMPGMLKAGYLRSTIAHGRVKQIDTTNARELAGVIAVFTFADVPRIRFATAGHPYALDPAAGDIADRLLLTDTVRYCGDEIAVVVAEDDITLARALKRIEVTYAPYPPLLTPKAALDPRGREIHKGSGNIIGESSYSVNGDMEQALEKSPVAIRAEYETQIVQHCHMENHTAFAYMDDLEHVVVVSSTQIPHIARRIVAQSLSIPWGRVRVIKPHIGGGFGNKQDVVLEPMVAFLTMRLGGRPVKIELSREEGMIGTRVRHPFQLKVRSGAQEDGILLALDVDAVSNNGAYASHGHSVAAAGGAKARALYPRAAVRYHARTVYTNLPAAGAMRAYGAPQVLFAIECAMEEMARKTGMDSVDFRLKNVVRKGDKDPLSGKAYASVGMAECLEKGKALIRWDQKRDRLGSEQTGSIRRGLGVACFSYASGTYPVCTEIAGARLILNQDGSVHVQVGATEIGQGSDTVIAQMASETLGIPYERIHMVSVQDTDVAPFDTGAYASRQAYVAGNAVFRAAGSLKKKILDYAKDMAGVGEQSLDIVNGHVVVAGQPHRTVLSVMDIALDAYYHKDRGGQLTAEVSHKTRTNAAVFGCTFVDLEVDVPLCQVRIRELYNVHDSGVVLNPVLAKGQVQGGAAMGIAAALYEELQVDEASGMIYNNNLLDYKFPTTIDLPEIGCDFVEIHEPTSGYGNKALGEPPIISPPPAIRNAIWDATGVKIDELPMTPKVLYRHFKQAGLLKPDMS